MIFNLFFFLVLLLLGESEAYYYLGNTFEVASNPFTLDLVPLPSSNNTDVSKLPRECTSNAEVIRLMTENGFTYCAGIVTWDVWANGPFKVVDKESVQAADILAREFYKKAKPLSFLNKGNDHRSSDKEKMQGPCLSYMQYWGCLSAFPHCKQRDPYNAQCRNACHEFNNRCRGTEGELKWSRNEVVECNNYPSVDCSLAATNRSISILSITASIVTFLVAAWASDY
eukprot:g1234.t1